MVTRTLTLAFLAAFILGLGSCGDDDTPTGGQPGPVDQFPTQIGMLWKYQVYDSLSHVTDTVWVSVTEGLPSVPEITVFVWRLYWTTRDSLVVRDVVLNGDTVEFWTDTTQTEPDLLERLLFPLELGREWVAPVGYGADTSRVEEIGTVTVPAGTFNNAALVTRVWNPDFEGGGNWSTTWLADNVGIVYRHLLSAFNPGGGVVITLNQTWKLIGYDLSTFSLKQFPNSIGTEWVYEWVDTLLDLVDTVSVTVIDKIEMPNFDSVMIWAYEGREYNDTVFVATSGRIVTMFLDTLAVMPFISWQYVFPMAVGRHWGIETFAAIPIVDDKAPVRTPAGYFRSSFHYWMDGGFLNDYWAGEDWLVPGIGVAKRNYTRWGLGPQAQQQWTLLSYRPAQ